VAEKRIEYSVIVATGHDGHPRTDLNAELASAAASGYRVVAATAQHIILERKFKEKKKGKDAEKDPGEREE